MALSEQQKALIHVELTSMEVSRGHRINETKRAAGREYIRALGHADAAGVDPDSRKKAAERGRSSAQMKADVVSAQRDQGKRGSRRRSGNSGLIDTDLAGKIS